MKHFPSSLQFSTYLEYSPRGNSETEIRSREYCINIKNNKSIDNRLFIDLVAERVRQSVMDFPFLRVLFDADTWLVPLPKSGLHRDGSLWVPKVICDCLVMYGQSQVVSLIKRTEPVAKSAYSRPGDRPDHNRHFETTAVDPDAYDLLSKPGRIVLVDDVLTRGATSFGVCGRVLDVFRDVPISAFAYVRTNSFQTVTQIRNPVEGAITLENGKLSRVP